MKPQPPLSFPVRTELPLLIAFTDLEHYVELAARVSPAELAEIVADMYACHLEQARIAGGTVVKFIGDSALIVFPADLAEDGVRALRDMRDAVRRRLGARGVHEDLAVRIHFGTVVAGPYPDGFRETRFDIIGNEVCRAAALRGSGVVISPEAFAQLGPDIRAEFTPDETTGNWILKDAG